MSVIFCKHCQEHEGQGIRFAASICPHLVQELDKGKKINENQFGIVKVKLIFLKTQIIYHWFCNQCVKNYHLPTDGQILSKEELNNKYKEAFNELKPYCYDCLENNLSKMQPGG